MRNAYRVPGLLAGGAGLLAGGTLLLAALSGPAAAADTAEAETVINIEVSPVAYLEFLDPALLALTIPPPGSTVPSNGVRFRVTGNAMASLSAEPDAFIDVPGEGFMGKAVLGAGSVGYKIELRFPRTGAPGSPVQVGVLPGFEPGPTPQLEVNLTLTGGQREGVIHMETNQIWTVDGGIPLPGIYVGQVILTLVADYL